MEDSTYTDVAEIIKTMYKNGYGIEEIARAISKEVEEVEAIIEDEDLL